MDNSLKKTDKQMSLAKRIVNFPQFSILIALVALIVIWSVLANNFLTVGNAINILRQASTLIIVCTGTTFVLILGGMDLSTGSIVGLVGMISASLFANSGLGLGPVLIISILLSAGIGLINGIIITKARIAPFIATLATMTTVEGIMLLYCNGRTISGIPNEVLFLGRGYVGPLPVPTLIMIVVVAIMWIVLRKTKFGRYVYAIGGNEECANLSGIRVDFVKISVYVIAGAVCGLAGLILMLRVGSGQTSLGEGIMMNAITATVLGGTTLAGGKGSMLGTILGCIFLITLTNGLNVMSVSSYWQKALTGVVLILAVLLYKKK